MELMHIGNWFVINITVIILYSIIDFVKNGNKNLKHRLIKISFWMYVCYFTQQITENNIYIPPRPSNFEFNIYSAVPFLYIKSVIIQMDLISRISDSSWLVLTIKDLLFTSLLMFPLGIYLQIKYLIGNFNRGLLIIVLTSLGLELLQPLLSYTGVIGPAAFETDIVILYTLGGIAGFYFYNFYNKMLSLTKVKIA